MIIRWSAFFLVILLSLGAVGQNIADSQAVSVEGFVTNTEGIYLQNIHIVNLTSAEGTVSSTNGQFRMQSLPGDTLRVTGIGYQATSICIPQVRYSPVIPVHIVMKADTMQLPVVQLYPWPSDAAALKSELLSMETPKSEVPDMQWNNKKFMLPNQMFSYQKSQVPGMMDPGVTVALPGPATLIYENFSRRAKSIRKFNALTERDTRIAMATVRYNAEVVRRITHFKTDKDIQEFMEYCNITVDFILHSTDYELYKAVYDCMLAYESSSSR
jgi:hypothetical protein